MSPGRPGEGIDSGDEGADAAALRRRLIEEMQAEFGADRRRIEHALKVLGYAEAILEAEGGDRPTVVAAAVLHDIGIQEAERKHGSAAGHWQEVEGPPIARAILERLAFDPATAEHVCRIVGSHHSAKDVDTPEFRAVWDADWLVNVAEERPRASREDPAGLVARVFRTETGRALARQSDWYREAETA